MKPTTRFLDALCVTGRSRLQLALVAMLVCAVPTHATGAAPEPAAGPAQSGQATASATPQVFTLSNGMTLIVQPDHRAPTAVHMLWVRVGAMDEVDGTSGIAHLLEHMMFKGTPSVPEGEFSRRVAALGGRENAFTSLDVTSYHQQIPANKLDAVMKLEADRFAHNQWSDGAFKRELEVVKEERRMRLEESPPAQLFEAFNATAFQAHPYRRPIIGWVSDLDHLAPEDARSFYRRWYVPANAAVVVVGDVDAAQVRAMAEKTYGRIPARAVPPRKPLGEPPQNGVRRVEFHGRSAQPVLLLGYKAPRLQQPNGQDPATQDALALMLLAGVLNGHSAARLDRALVQGEGGPRLADSVGVFFDWLGRGPELFLLSASPAAGVEPARVEAALKAQIQRVASEGVNDAELQRVKNQWTASEVFKRDSMFMQARELGSYWAQGWPLDSGALLMQRLRSVTAQQVQDVARRWFDERQLTVGVLVPEVQP